MSRDLQSLRQFEAEYYRCMPSQVREREAMRNNGIDQVKEAENEQEAAKGADILAQSVHGLRSAEGLYQREYFASLYMQARGEFLLGEHDYAGDIAEKAMAHLPEVPPEFAGDVIADQYVAIASGKLSLILSASYNGEFPFTQWGDSSRREAAIEAARLARATCRHSEDRSLMLFADGALSNEQRKKAKRNHTIAAAGATAGLWLPQPLVLAMAEKICRR